MAQLWVKVWRRSWIPNKATSAQPHSPTHVIWWWLHPYFYHIQVDHSFSYQIAWFEEEPLLTPLHIHQISLISRYTTLYRAHGERNQGPLETTTQCIKGLELQDWISYTLLLLTLSLSFVYIPSSLTWSLEGPWLVPHWLFDSFSLIRPLGAPSWPTKLEPHH